MSHRYLAPRMAEEIERATRTGSEMSILLMDLDHFKNVNDEHGHAVGDAVLRTASNFDRPYPGQTPYDSLVNSNSGGFVPSLNNLYLAGGPLVNEIVTRWSVWKHGVPSP